MSYAPTSYCTVALGKKKKKNFFFFFKCNRTIGSRSIGHRVWSMSLSILTELSVNSSMSLNTLTELSVN